MDTAIACSMTDEEMLPFCDAESTRYAIGAPFVLDGWKYATDTRVCIRVPCSEPNRQSGEGRFVPADKVFAGFPSGGFSPMGEVVDVKGNVVCQRCAGEGRIDRARCRRCGGAGYVYCDHCDNENDCRECRGKGLTIGDLCPECLGKKVIPGIERVTVRGLQFRPLYVTRVLGLPDVVFQVDQQTRLIFTFAGGGQGILMPIVD